MLDKKDNKPSKDILQILREAEDANNAAKNVEIAPRKPEMDKTRVASATPNDKRRHMVTKRFNAETADLIDKYSSRKQPDTMTDTQKLRAKLAEQNENSELLGYLTEDKGTGTSKRVEKLYDMINDARTRTLSDLEKKPPVGIGASRFSDEANVPVQEEYAQEEMFPMGETIRFEQPVSDNGVAEYDSEYEQLTEKVTSRGIEEEADDGQVKFDTDNDDLSVCNNEEELDETDINLRLAFDMMEDEHGALEKIAKRNRESSRRHKEEQEENHIKYTSRDQNAVVAGMYRKRMRKSFFNVLIVALLALGVLIMETYTAESTFLPEYLRPGSYGMVYILVDLQLLCFIALAMLEDVRNGIRGIVKFTLNSNSLLVMSIFFAATYSLVMAFTNPMAVDIKLYSLPAAFAALCSAISKWLAARKDYKCFRIVASKRPKYTACELKGGTREADEFYKYLFEDSDIYTVKRTRFIDGFVERTERRAKFEDVFNFIVPTVFVAGVALFIVMTLLGNSAPVAFQAFSVIIAASVPVSSFFMISLPVVSANRIGAKHSTAFVGNAIAEEYATASVLSFADTEVFPASLVKITNIRMYGDTRIDSIITDLAKIFKYVGGPLAKVLSATLTENVESPAMIRVIESSNDGLCVAMEGHNFFMGKRSYMRRYRFECPVDEGDEAYENGVGSVMYVVMDEKLAAKLYIKYSINPLFDSLLKDMYKAGLCLGVKTLDPNINNDLINRGVKFRKCPISVLRGNDPEDVLGEVDRVDSGVVCNSTLHNFLKMFSLCDKVRHITKSNVIISVVSVFLSFITVAFLAVTGGITAITSLHAVAFQLFWLLPVCLISFLLMKK